jgi:very-short-patch-repair endonuclease
MTKIYNKITEKLRRRMLRKNMPKAEVMLWSKLRGKGLSGYKFRRQYSVGKFVIDFYCPKLKLAIEVDGDSHFIKEADTYDKERQTIIETLGITFLRFTNREIYENIDGVLEKIMEYMTPPLSSP